MSCSQWPGGGGRWHSYWSKLGFCRVHNASSCLPCTDGALEVAVTLPPARSELEEPLPESAVCWLWGCHHHGCVCASFHHFLPFEQPGSLLVFSPRLQDRSGHLAALCELVPHKGEGERRARCPGRSVQVVSMARCPGSSCPLLYKYVHKATCASSPGSSRDPCWETGEGRLVLDTVELKPQISGGVKRRVPLTPGDFGRMLPVMVLCESPGSRAPPQGMSPPTSPRRASRRDLQPM